MTHFHFLKHLLIQCCVKSHMLPNVMFLICGENFSMLFVGGGILDHHLFLYNMLTELCWCLKHDLQLFQNCDT